MPFSRNKMLCYEALPHEGQFSRTIEQAASFGFRDLSLWMNAIEQGIAEQGSVQGLRHFLDQHNMQATVLEILMAWPADGRPSEASTHIDEAIKMRDLAAELGSEIIMAACLQDKLTDEQQSCERLAEQCRIVGEAGCKVALEFLPWTGMPDIATARRIVEQAAEPNLGYTLDTWHFARSGADYQILTELPKGSIHVVQVSDASDESKHRDIIDETMNARVVPGEGNNDWARLSAIIAANNSDALIGPEIFSEEIKSLPMEEALEILRSTSVAGGFTG